MTASKSVGKGENSDREKRCNTPNEVRQEYEQEPSEFSRKKKRAYD